MKDNIVCVNKNMIDLLIKQYYETGQENGVVFGLTVDEEKILDESIIEYLSQQIRDNIQDQILNEMLLF